MGGVTDNPPAWPAIPQRPEPPRFDQTVIGFDMGCLPKGTVNTGFLPLPDVHELLSTSTEAAAGYGLDTVIRATLNGWLNDICGAWRGGCPIDGHAEAIKMRAALIAVLGKHREDHVEDDEPHCAECSGLAGVRMRVPCPTVLAIAAALGVRAS
jgi:hypothetical protein